MSDVFKNKSVALANTAQTTVYTVPTADVSTVPAQKPVQAIIKSIRVCNVTAGAQTITIVNTDSSVGANINITNLLSIAANTATEILSQPLVLENLSLIHI